MARAAPIITTPTEHNFELAITKFSKSKFRRTLLAGSSTMSAISNQYQIHYRPTIKDEMAHSNR